MRLTYVANARLPTEKAHGYQIVSMCEAFGEEGAQVQLVHPARHQVDPALRGADVYRYYSVKPTFKIREILGVDVTQWSNVLPARIIGAACLVRSVGWAWRVSRALAAEIPPADVYYTRDPAAALFLTERGAPVAFEAHVVPRRAQRLVLQRLSTRPALRMTAALTEAIRERLITLGFPAARIAVHRDAVDPRRFEHLPDRLGVRAQLGLDPARPIVGYVGRFTALGMEKGIEELIDAVAHVRRDNGMNLMLLCVGGPLDRIEEYRRRAAAQGLPEDAVRFVDRVPPDRVPLWMRACDIGTIPWGWNEFSAYFTSPLKLFEYLAAGLPIVASDLPSLREVLTGGKDALFVEPGNAASLAGGIRTVLENPELREGMAASARRSAAHHTWSRRAAAILADFRALSGEPSREFKRVLD